MSEAVANDDLLQGQSADSHLRFEVTNGLHAGVNIPLENGDYTIGSTPDADIVLRDAGVSAQHLILCVDKREVRAEAIGGPVKIGEETVETGFGYRVVLPAMIKVGSASIRLSQPGRDVAARSGASLADRIPANTTAVVVGAAVVLFLLSVGAYGIFSPPSEGSGARSAVALAPPTDPAKSATKADRLLLAAGSLRLKLSQAGLGSIQVASDGTRLDASGKIAASKHGQWAEIQRWFDGKFAPDIVLAANVSSDDAAPMAPIRLEGIWLGDRPHIIADNGMRYYEGTVTNSGWILQSIQNNRIMLRKDGETLSLNYR